ncbi:MAG: amidase [Beijerinckiaceae bacterium]|jgi:amidase|nr:amidase [Beijerinckiaceae bacterium]
MLIAHDYAHAFVPYPPLAVAGSASGPLSSLSFGVKDLFDVAGYPTGCGSPVKLAESGIKSTSSSAVTRLLDAGATFLGKTHTEEMAWSLYGTNVHFGTPLNPAARDRVPGGSSSGSASAVAAKLCDFALGSDTGGSVRAPASFCGIYGLRPTHGAAPLDHCMPLAPSFDTCGYFARNAATMQAVGRVLLNDGAVPASRLMKATDLFARLTPEVAAALAPAVAAIESAIGKAEEIEMYDRPIAPIFSAFRHLQSYEIHVIHGAWVEKQKPRLGPTIAGRFAFARTVTDADVVTARATRAAFATHLHALLANGGVVIAPVVPGPAPRLDDSQETLEAYRNEAMAFLQPAGLAGLPQLVIPGGMVGGAPVGLSLIGGKGSDLALLEIATRVEAQTK